ncbi:hypothetical protein [Sorangium sp. So ce1153]|uniref:hypothetical protein n=1 Tax=Sorangium sp. So ce1153 TaxID=3133333 RepID=UPI003F5F96DA
MLASRSLVEHLARGVLGFGAVAASALLAPASRWASLALLPVALVALRGCPMCWALGLIQTVMARARGERPEGACRGARCAAALDERRLESVDAGRAAPRAGRGRHVDSPGSPH